MGFFRNVWVIATKHLELCQSYEVKGKVNQLHLSFWSKCERLPFSRIDRLVHSDGGTLLIQFIYDDCISSR